MNSTIAPALRDIPLGSAVCTVCNEVVPLARSKARIGQPMPLRMHGPKRSRCPGGGIPGMRWIEAQGLPGWEAMSDLDRGCALLFLWKAHWERSFAYARENYPCRYLDNPRLVRLPPFEACRHAAQAAVSHREIEHCIGQVEWQRLYDLALAASEVAS